MRLRDGTTGQKALFALIVCVFFSIVGLHLFLFAEHIGVPNVGFAWQPNPTPPAILIPYRAGVAEQGLVFGSRWQVVNGKPATHLFFTQGQSLLRTEIGATNVLSIQQPSGARREVALPVTAYTWSDAWFSNGTNHVIGTLYFLILLLFFCLRPYQATSWALLCLGSFGGAQTFKYHTYYVYWDINTELYSWVSCMFAGIFTACLYHSALAFPVPHRWLRRAPRAAAWLYLGGVLPAGLWLAAYEAIQHDRPDLTGTLGASGQLLIFFGFCLLVARQGVWAVGRRDRVAQQRARLLLFGFALGLLPVSATLVLQSTFGLLLSVPWSMSFSLSLLVPLTLGYAMVRIDMFDARIAVRRAGAFALAGAAAAVVVWAGAQLHPMVAAASLLPVLYVAPRFNTRLNAFLYPKRAQFPALHRAIGDELAAAPTREAVLETLAKAPLRVCETGNAAAFLLPGAIDANEHLSWTGDVDLSDVHGLLDEPLIHLLVGTRQTIKREGITVDPQFARIQEDARACMDRLHASVLLPIVHESKVIGGLVVGPHVSGDVYDPAELELLEDITHDAVHALATAELREASGKAVARGAERDAGSRGDRVTSPPIGTSDTTPIPARARTAELVAPAITGHRYQVTRLLGWGGYKHVYLAHDTRLRRDVALAVIHADGLPAGGRDRIYREAQAMAQLGDHPHLVTVYDMGEAGDDLYIVSQYMAGGDLDARLAAAPDRRLPVADALRIAQDLCLALGEAHAHGILHRDIKPGNVWFRADGRAALGDFGLALATAESRITESGYLVGTLPYMAPELFAGAAPSVQSDLYALGVLLFEMVVGRRPHVAESTAGMMRAHVRPCPIAPSAANPCVPPPLDAIILRLLATTPAARYESAVDLHAALQGIEV